MNAFWYNGSIDYTGGFILVTFALCPFLCVNLRLLVLQVWGVNQRQGNEPGCFYGQIRVFDDILQSERLPLLAVAWEIWMMALSFQASTRVKERKRGRNGFMFSKVWSLYPADWMEVVYLDVGNFSNWSVWFVDLQCLYRTWCQVEPSAMKRVPKF